MTLKRTCVITIDASLLPPSAQLDASFSKLSENLANCGHMKGDTPSKSKVVKVSLMSKSLQCVDLDKRGSAKALADSFNLSWNTARRLIKDSAEGKTVEELVQPKKRKDINETEWPSIVEEFCLTKPICRKAPGETVSVGYGQRAEKYIRQFSVEEIFAFFMQKHPEFSYCLSTFRRLVPKNLVRPTLRDVKQNTCPSHENVTRNLVAINRSF